MFIIWLSSGITSMKQPVHTTPPRSAPLSLTWLSCGCPLHWRWREGGAHDRSGGPLTGGNPCPSRHAGDSRGAAVCHLGSGTGSCPGDCSVYRWGASQELGDCRGKIRGIKIYNILTNYNTIMKTNFCLSILTQIKSIIKVTFFICRRNIKYLYRSNS